MCWPKVKLQSLKTVYSVTTWLVGTKVAVDFYMVWYTCDYRSMCSYIHKLLRLWSKKKWFKLHRYLNLAILFLTDRWLKMAMNSLLNDSLLPYFPLLIIVESLIMLVG